MVDRRHQFGGLGHGVDERRLAAGERFDAVDDPVAPGDVGDAFERLGEATKSHAGCVARGDRTLLRRAVDEDSAAEFGAQAGEALHHVEGALPDRGIGNGQRQAARLDQEPVQARDHQAEAFHGAADAGGLGARDRFRRLGQGERRDLQAVVAQRRGVLALALQRHLGQDFVAERELHGVQAFRGVVAASTAGRWPRRR